MLWTSRVGSRSLGETWVNRQTARLTSMGCSRLRSELSKMNDIVVQFGSPSWATFCYLFLHSSRYFSPNHQVAANASDSK
jgi:hypothetical protein